MLVSSYLKVKINDQAPTMSYITNGDFSAALNTFQGAEIEDLVVLSHLKSFFNFEGDLFDKLPWAQTLNPDYNYVLGEVYNQSNVRGHSEDSVSLVGIDKVSGILFLANILSRERPELKEALLDGGLDQAQQILEDFGIGGIEILSSEVELKFYEASEEDINPLPRDYNYTDAFPDLKRLANNTEDSVEGLGFQRVEYSNLDNSLSFISGCSIKLSPPPIIPEIPADGSLSFLKFNNRILNKDLGQEIGLLYSVNGGEIQKASFQTVTAESPSVNMSVLASIGGIKYVLGFESSVFEWQQGLPQGLSGDFSFIFGFDNETMNKFFEIMDFESPPPEFVLPEEDFEIRIYPKSALPNSGLDFDVFELVVEPQNYTVEDLTFFSEMGITPATINSDGSYTIHSKSQLPNFGRQNG